MEKASMLSVFSASLSEKEGRTNAKKYGQYKPEQTSANILARISAFGADF